MTDLLQLGPYGEAEGSVLASLNKMSRRERIRYWLNVKKYKEDQQAIEQWASSGFMATTETEEE
jgi:hypothetical protein